VCVNVAYGEGTCVIRLVLALVHYFTL